MSNEDIEMSDETVNTAPEESNVETETIGESVPESETYASLTFHQEFEVFNAHYENIESMLLFVMIGIGLVFGGIVALIFSHHR